MPPEILSIELTEHLKFKAQGETSHLLTQLLTDLQLVLDQGVNYPNQFAVVSAHIISKAVKHPNYTHIAPYILEPHEKQQSIYYFDLHNRFSYSRPPLTLAQMNTVGNYLLTMNLYVKE